MRSHSTFVVHRSRYSYAMCTQNHVFVREKVVRFSRFQRFVESAERTSGNEIGSVSCKQACRRQGSRGSRHGFIWGIYTTNGNYQLQGLDTELVYFGIKNQLKKRKGLILKRKPNALTVRLSGRLYSSTELDRLGFCDLQQRSDVY
jgi:hypothetical protein